jgi:hypothetical protein
MYYESIFHNFCHQLEKAFYNASIKVRNEGTSTIYRNVMNVQTGVSFGRRNRVGPPSNYFAMNLLWSLYT